MRALRHTRERMSKLLEKTVCVRLPEYRKDQKSKLRTSIVIMLIFPSALSYRHTEKRLEKRFLQ
jgi:hypothetical protein